MASLSSSSFLFSRLSRSGSSCPAVDSAPGEGSGSSCSAVDSAPGEGSGSSTFTTRVSSFLEQVLRALKEIKTVFHASKVKRCCGSALISQVRIQLCTSMRIFKGLKNQISTGTFLSFCCLVLEKIKDKSFGHLLIVKILLVTLFKLLVAKEGGRKQEGGSGAVFMYG